MSISIIIPTRNEAACIASQIAYLQSLSRYSKTSLEIIVCDGQSSDETASVAREGGAVVVETFPNRGLQQNAGAERATKGVLWFLHADARPHPDSLLHLEKVALNHHFSGGNFRLCFEGSTSSARALAAIARLQRARGIYYGDSGIWARREVFDVLGGFRDWPLFEDYDFARRLEMFSRRNGMKTQYSLLPITASSRRLQKREGKVLAQWLILQLLFSFGASPEKLARLYFDK